MIGYGKLARIALIGLSMFFPMASAGALVAEPTPIDQSVPENWRAPLARFLEEFGAKDVDSILNASKATRFPGDDADRILFRIVDPFSCTPDLDICITVIGRVADGALDVQAIFRAGGRMTTLDTAPRVLGARSFPVAFYGKTSAIAVIQTAKGLMLSP
jgi:hypothetical protein